ncbi:MAG: pilus assembly PilX family protein [Halothiobacillaceae bacterium]
MILLLVMTILGITAMQSTTLQERMAGNMKDRNAAFQAAEAALREAEEVIASDWPTLLGSMQELSTAAANWDGQDGTVVATTLDDQLFQQPRYHIGPEELVRINPGELPAEFDCAFPITTIAWGAQETTVVILESLYKQSPCD